MTRPRNTTGIVTREAVTARREKVFIAAYLSMLSAYHPTAANGTQAAIKAGYAPKGAAFMATQILKRPHVKAIIAARLEELTAKYAVTAERTLAEIASLAYSNVRDFAEPQEDGSVILDLTKLSRADFAAVSQLETEEYITGLNAATGAPVRVRATKLKFHDKMAALTCLAKIENLIRNAPQVNIQNNIYRSPEWTELQALQQHELQEFEEFKKQRRLSAGARKDVDR
jgi:phage terminase small subunit